MKKAWLTNSNLIWAGRITMFVIFFWFGLLKLLMISPADTLVDALLQNTMPFISFQYFFIFLGLYEVITGLLFLIPKISRVVIFMLSFHMFTTFFPLILLPDITWSGLFTPTIEGQYIIKNLALVSLALLVTIHHQEKLS